WKLSPRLTCQGLPIFQLLLQLGGWRLLRQWHEEDAGSSFYQPNRGVCLKAIAIHYRTREPHFAPFAHDQAAHRFLRIDYSRVRSAALACFAPDSTPVRDIISR